jgi:hypothetical protein
MNFRLADGRNRIGLFQNSYYTITDSAGGSSTPVAATLQPTQGTDEDG